MTDVSGAEELKGEALRRRWRGKDMVKDMSPADSGACTLPVALSLSLSVSLFFRLSAYNRRHSPPRVLLWALVPSPHPAVSPASFCLSFLLHLPSTPWGLASWIVLESPSPF